MANFIQAKEVKKAWWSKKVVFVTLLAFKANKNMVTTMKDDSKYAK